MHEERGGGRPAGGGGVREKEGSGGVQRGGTRRGSGGARAPRSARDDCSGRARGRRRQAAAPSMRAGLRGPQRSGGSPASVGPGLRRHSVREAVQIRPTCTHSLRLRAGSAQPLLRPTARAVGPHRPSSPTAARTAYPSPLAPRLGPRLTGRAASRGAFNRRPDDHSLWRSQRASAARVLVGPSARFTQSCGPGP